MDAVKNEEFTIDEPVNKDDKKVAVFLKSLYVKSYDFGRGLMIQILGQENYDKMVRHETKMGRYMTPGEILLNFRLKLKVQLDKSQADDIREQLAKIIYRINFDIEDSDLENFHHIDFAIRNGEGLIIPAVKKKAKATDTLLQFEMED